MENLNLQMSKICRSLNCRWVWWFAHLVIAGLTWTCKCPRDLQKVELLPGLVVCTFGDELGMKNLNTRMSKTLAAAEAWIGGFGFACLVLSFVWSLVCVSVLCCDKLFQEFEYQSLSVNYCVLVFGVSSAKLQSSKWWASYYAWVIQYPICSQKIRLSLMCCPCCFGVSSCLCNCQNVCFAVILFLTEEPFKTLTLFSKDQALDAFSMLFWCFFRLCNLQDVFCVASYS